MQRAGHVPPTATPQQDSVHPGQAGSRLSGQYFAQVSAFEPEDRTVERDAGNPRLDHDFGRLTIFPGTIHDTDGRRADRRPSLSEPIPYRAEMERRFGSDFSTVNVFRGAAGLLAPFGARAAAWPETVAFSSTTPSRTMVAHELTHVLQYRTHPDSISSSASTARAGNHAEAEARRASHHLENGTTLRPRARPQGLPMLFTDEDAPDSEDFLQERPPQFTNQEVGTWGNTWPATLVARERLGISYPDTERSHAIVEAIVQRAPVVILHEYGRLWLYRLEWEGLSARYSRFTNAETIFHEGTAERRLLRLQR